MAGMFSTFNATPARRNQTYDLNHDPGDVSGNRVKQGIMDTGRQADATQAQSGESRNSLVGLLSQDPSKILSDYVSGAMPEFNQQLQGIRENAIARGIGTGDLGTAYEGSLASAFQRNLTSKAADLYGTRLGGMESLHGMDVGENSDTQNRYFDLLTGRQDLEEGRRQADKNRKAGLLSGLMSTIGNSAGLFAGG